MLNAIKKIFGIKPAEPVSEAPYKVETPLVQLGPEPTITAVGTAPYTVPETAVAIPIPLVTESIQPVVAKAVPAKKTTKAKAPTKPKVVKVAAMKPLKKPRAPKAV